MNAKTAYWAMLTLLIGAIPLLCIAWIRSYSPPKTLSTVRLVVLVVASMSHAWLLMSWWSPDVFLRESYSNIRFAIIDAHFLLMLGSSVAAACSTGRGKAPLVLACCFTTSLWSFVAAINLVV
jgi:hypothetical protein